MKKAIKKIKQFFCKHRVVFANGDTAECLECGKIFKNKDVEQFIR